MAENPRDPAAELPLRSHMLDILMVLLDGERHGYALVTELRERPAGPVLQPANLYRTLRTMLARGLIEETDARPDPEMDDERRRYFRATDFGREVARLEARRLAELVERARRRHLLEDPGARS